jgi:hypothetical protein
MSIIPSPAARYSECGTHRGRLYAARLLGRDVIRISGNNVVRISGTRTLKPLDNDESD